MIIRYLLWGEMGIENKQWKTEEIARDILMHNHHYFGEEFTHIWKVISERMKLESTKIKPLKLIKNPLKAKIENGKVYFEYEIINPLKTDNIEVDVATCISGSDNIISNNPKT